MSKYVCPQCGKDDKIGTTDLWDKSNNVHRCGHCYKEWKYPITREQYEEKLYKKLKKGE